MSDQWVIHRSRFAPPAGAKARPAATPFRVTALPPARRGVQGFACIARVPMPQRAGGRRDPKGRVDFDGDTWAEVAGSALMFARRHNPKAPRIGIKYPGSKHYSWWDGTTSIDDRLAGEDAADCVKAWLEHLFPVAVGRMTVSAQ